jgi:hypothetical protein
VTPGSSCTSRLRSTHHFLMGGGVGWAPTSWSCSHAYERSLRVRRATSERQRTSRRAGIRTNHPAREPHGRRTGRTPDGPHRDSQAERPAVATQRTNPPCAAIAAPAAASNHPPGSLSENAPGRHPKPRQVALRWTRSPEVRRPQASRRRGRLANQGPADVWQRRRSLIGCLQFTLRGSQQTRNVQARSLTHSGLTDHELRSRRRAEAHQAPALRGVF